MKTADTEVDNAKIVSNERKAAYAFVTARFMPTPRYIHYDAGSLLMQIAPFTCEPRSANMRPYC